MFSHLGDLFNVPDRLQPVAIYQHRFQYTISTKRLRSPLTLRPLLLSVSPGRKRPTHLCSISLRVAIPACCWLAVLARAMAGLAARESIVMSGEWMDSREGKACSSNTWEGGESAKRERGLWATRTTNYATPAFPDKHRRLFPPPTYPLEDLLLCLSLYFVESLFEKSLFEKSVDFASSKKKKRLDKLFGTTNAYSCKKYAQGDSKTLFLVTLLTYLTLSGPQCRPVRWNEEEEEEGCRCRH